MKETKCDGCEKEFNFGDEYYDDLCDDCAHGEGRNFDEYEQFNIKSNNSN